MKKNIAMAFLSLFLLSGAATLLSACNTTAGVGEDMSAAGKAITGTANNTKEKM